MSNGFRIRDSRRDDGMPKDPSVRFFAADPAYWSQPLYARAYMRLLYAICAFLLCAWVFRSSPLPVPFQAFVCGSVALAALIYRMAFPAGSTGTWEWLMEGMVEAAEEREAIGKASPKSSKELKEAIVAHRMAKAEKTEMSQVDDAGGEDAEDSGDQHNDCA